MLLFPKVHNPRLIMRKPSGKSKLRNTPQHTCPVLLRAVKIIIKKKTLRNSNRFEETKWTREQNKMWYFGLNSGIEKGH